MDRDCRARGAETNRKETGAGDRINGDVLVNRSLPDDHCSSMRLISEKWKIFIMFVIRVKFGTIRVSQEIHMAFQVKAEGLGFAQKYQIW